MRGFACGSSTRAAGFASGCNAAPPTSARGGGGGGGDDDSGGDGGGAEGGEGGKAVGSGAAAGDGDGDGDGDGTGVAAHAQEPQAPRRGSSGQAAAQRVDPAAARAQGEVGAIAQIGRLSRPARGGCALWLLATKPLPKLGAPRSTWRPRPQPAELIAPNVLACVVPEAPCTAATASATAPEAVPVPLRVTGTNGAGRPFGLRCELAFTIQRGGSG